MSQSISVSRPPQLEGALVKARDSRPCSSGDLRQQHSVTMGSDLHDGRSRTLTEVARSFGLVARPGHGVVGRGLFTLLLSRQPEQVAAPPRGRCQCPASRWKAAAACRGQPLRAGPLVAWALEAQWRVRSILAGPAVRRAPLMWRRRALGGKWHADVRQLPPGSPAGTGGMHSVARRLGTGTSETRRTPRRASGLP